MEVDFEQYQSRFADWLAIPGHGRRQNKLESSSPTLAKTLKGLPAGLLQSLDRAEQLEEEEKLALVTYLASQLKAESVYSLISEIADKIAGSSWRLLFKRYEKAFHQVMLATMEETPPQNRKVIHQFVTALIKPLAERDLEELIAEIWAKLPDRQQIELRRQLKKIVPLDYLKKKIQIGCESSTELITRAHSVEKEPELVQWIETKFKDGDVFYDIGANVGAYSLIAGALFKDKIQVFAFEPSYPSFARLVDNIFLNQLESTIKPVPFALAQSTVHSEISLAGLKEGQAFNFLSEYVQDGLPTEKIDPKEVRKQSVFAVALDECIAQFKLPLPTMCKIDVDGFELPLLKGAEKTLSNPALREIHMELSTDDKNYEKIVSLLGGWGYKIQTSTERGGKTANIVFAR